MNLTPEQASLLAILAGALVLLMTERFRGDVVAVGIVLALYLSRVLDAPSALAGFSSEPAIVVAAVFVLSAGLQHTGVSETLASAIGRLSGSGIARTTAVLMPSVALLSAFTHHVTTTAVMIPVVLRLCRERGLAPSKLLMPLSIAASLGTTITVIGAPAFLIADGVLRQTGHRGLNIFAIAPIGLALSAVGTLFVLTAGRVLLPHRDGGSDAGSRFRLDDYFTELKILPGSVLVGRTIAQLEADPSRPLHVVGIVRGRRAPLAPLPERAVREGDVLLVRTSPEHMLAIRNDEGVELHPIARYGLPERKSSSEEEETDAGLDRIVQAVIGPGSDLVGRTIGEVDVRDRYGALVVGLWRRSGWLDDELSRIQLREGDVLVLNGDEASLERVAADPAFLMLVPFQGEARLRRRARRAALIMVATVALAVADVAPLSMVTLGGALVMVVSGCVTGRQAYRAMDPRIFVFIAGAMPLGEAMTRTGTSQLVASGLHRLLEGAPTFVVLLALFVVVGLLTQIMSDAATTALLAPVAVALAESFNQPPKAYVVTVAMAAVATMLTPMGHHGNLLVYGPGHYQFRDFVKVGVPLSILVALVVTLLSVKLWIP